MIRIFLLALVALNFLASCASNQPYQPATKMEKIEYANDRPDIYPEDVRKNIDRYTNTAVAWAGIIQSTDARDEDIGGKINANTIFAHHYYDWVQEDKDGIRLVVSPRGEGFFRTDWHLRKIEPDADSSNAEKFAAKGKLAIVYGVPKSVDDDGTVVLEYRFLRIVGRDHFTTNEVDYGRSGEPFRPVRMPNSASAQP
jgi:hypothetical protein